MKNQRFIAFCPTSTVSQKSPKDSAPLFASKKDTNPISKNFRLSLPL
jgi:hypothetical protein